MSAFAFDPDNLDEDALAELTEEDLADLTEDELDELLEAADNAPDEPDTLAGYARSAARRRPPTGRRRITHLPPI